MSSPSIGPPAAIIRLGAVGLGLLLGAVAPAALAGEPGPVRVEAEAWLRRQLEGLTGPEARERRE